MKKLILFLTICAAALAQPPVQRMASVANASSTGTTVNKLAKLTGAPSKAVVSGAGDTGGVIGIVVSGAGTTGSATIQQIGEASCVFDGATTAGHYVGISASVAGDCADAGASFPSSGQVIGVVMSTNGGGGTYTVDLSLGQASARTASAQVDNTDTLTCSVIGANTPTLFSKTYSVPANTLIANKVLRLSLGMTMVGTAVPTFTLKVKLGSTYIWASTGSPTNSTRATGLQFLIQGTAAGGGSVNVDTAIVGFGVVDGPINTPETTTQPVAVATNATNTLAFELTCSANTAGNSVTLRQFLVEVLN